MDNGLPGWLHTQSFPRNQPLDFRPQCFDFAEGCCNIHRCLNATALAQSVFLKVIPVLAANYLTSGRSVEHFSVVWASTQHLPEEVLHLNHIQPVLQRSNTSREQVMTHCRELSHPCYQFLGLHRIYKIRIQQNRYVMYTPYQNTFITERRNSFPEVPCAFIVTRPSFSFSFRLSVCHS